MSDTDAAYSALNDNIAVARNRAVGGLDQDPEEAARAIRLAEITGVPSTVIHGDVDGFVNDQKARTTSHIVKNNPYIASYINSHPLASMLSNDDLANLDEWSKALQGFNERKSIFQQMHEVLAPIHQFINPDVIPKSIRAATEEFGQQTANQFREISQARPDEDSQLAKQYPQLYEEGRSGLALIRAGVATAMLPFSGVISLANHYFGREAAAYLEYEFMRGDIRSSGTPKELAEMKGAWDAVRPWTQLGKEPPPNIHPVIDKTKIDDAKEDAKLLDEMVQKGQASSSREQAPNFIADNFAKAHGDAKIGIKADAIVRLYGEDPTELDWIPNLRERLAATAGSGGTIDVPAWEYASKIDPEIHKELREDILSRDHGFTLNEAKEVEDVGKRRPEIPEQEPGEPAPVQPQGLRTLEGPLQVLRGSAGLEPMAAVGDRKLTLEKLPPPVEGEILGPDEFHILDEKGETIGFIRSTPFDDGRKVYIDRIGSFESKGYHANSFGPALVRSIRQQLKQAYPNMEQIGGFRISGARKKAGTEREVWIKAEQGDLEAHQQFANLLEGKWENVYHPDVEALFKTDEKGLAADSPLGQMVLSELRRVAPKGVEGEVAHGLVYAGEPVYGLYFPNLKRIIVSLESPDPFHTTFHEVGHGLRGLGLFTNDEWGTLEGASLSEGWMKKYDIANRYRGMTNEQMTEEAIMHAYPDWIAGAKMPPEVTTLFGRIKDFLAGLLKKVADHLGLRADTWQDVFQKMEAGEIAARARAPLEDTAEYGVMPQRPPLAQRPEGPEPINIRLPFTDGKMIGVRQDIYRNYMKLIRERHATQLAEDFDRIYDKERRTQTKEWKENAAAVREQVESELGEKPNILLDRLLSERAGELKIDPMSLREDLRNVLPKEYMRRTNSMSADDLAGYFGYPSGDAMVEHLAELTADRQASGLSYRDYVKKLTDDEVNRRMEAQHGFLEKNYLEDAKDRALSQNQIDILDQQVIMLANRAGATLPLERRDIIPGLRETFSKMPVGTISSDKWLRDAGVADREFKEAASKEDWMEAMKAMERQHLATVQGKWANEYEKDRKSLDKIAKRTGKITPENMKQSSIEPEFINHIQDQLYRVGYKGRRSWDNIRENIALQREKTLEAFVNYHLSSTAGMRDLPIADFMTDTNFQKPIDQMTYGEFKQFTNAINGLVTNGRDLKTYETARGKIALEDARKMFIDGLSESREAKLPSGPEDKPGTGRSFAARLTSIPTVFNLFDRLDRSGPWNELARSFLDADAAKIAWEKAIEKEWKALGDYGDLNKKIAPPPMMPRWSEGYNNFTRGNLLGMIANMGNKSNFVKMAAGWEVPKTQYQALWDWVIANSTREDWIRAQKMGDNIFNEIVKRGDIVHERVNGSTVDKLPLTPFEIDFKDGKPPLQLKGWYHKLIPDPIWYGEKQRAVGGFNDSNFGHINTSDGWTRTRTGAVYPIDLSFGMLPARISQMVHDITHREVVLEGQKIMMNNEVRNAITKYWGKEYTDLMEPYLREQAGQYAMPSENMARMEQASEFLRGNVMTTYIGFNPSTPMKHFPTAFFQSLREGKLYFLKAYAQQWLGLRPQAGNFWGQYAMEHSVILQGRDRNWRDALGNSLEFPKADFDFTDWRQWRNEISRWGAKVVAWSDMASAKALWIGQYQRYLAEGIDARTAISRADQDVIRQHGALLMSNKPEIVRQAGNLHGWLTSVYGFMGERFQRLRETAWKINESWNLMERKEFNKATKMIPGIAADYLTYVVQVGLWEEAATAALSDEHRSLGMRLFNIAFGNIASSIIYAREIYHAAETGQDPGTGLLSSAAADVSNVIRDAFKGREALNRQHAGKTIRDLSTLLGVGMGLSTKPLAKIEGFATDIATGQQRPKTINDYFHGLTRGPISKRKPR